MIDETLSKKERDPTADHTEWDLAAEEARRAGMPNLAKILDHGKPPPRAKPIEEETTPAVEPGDATPPADGLIG
jgi:hypothetical protein